MFSVFFNHNMYEINDEYKKSVLNYYNLAIQNNNIFLLKQIYDKNQLIKWNEEAYFWSIRTNNLEILKWLYETDKQNYKNYIDNNRYTALICIEAIRIKSYDILEFINQIIPTSRWPVKCSIEAVKNESIDILIWLLYNNIKWNDECFLESIRVGNLDIVKWFYYYNYNYIYIDKDKITNYLTFNSKNIKKEIIDFLYEIFSLDKSDQIVILYRDLSNIKIF